ncbi:DUF2236 domain-containing protein [Mucilaginibacter limnophilus]|uniref:DUF2236 domain-containing protein n=2 Tax=Mucilaginibacter limnophilus TaxID=1932778 RepID=A0A437MS82_9SPHI|nr:DUF2236 domain-containing protein [Mucilaginibacter limnophilus]
MSNTGYFVDKHSIVRKIWGRADTVLFIFAGASAEFALNKAVDWLYFTGKLPADPLGRLFSTVNYARMIVFSEQETAMKAISQITAIHKGVEEKRGDSIPAWAYRDVLFMLIDYSIRSYELLEEKLSDAQRAEIFRVFSKVGEGMNIPGLPENYSEWAVMRESHLNDNLIKSDCTVDLYKQYKKHLGFFRYVILMQVQALLSPARVKKLLDLKESGIFKPIICVYKLCRKINLDGLLKEAILPANYKVQIKALDIKGL